MLLDVLVLEGTAFSLADGLAEVLRADLAGLSDARSVPSVLRDLLPDSVFSGSEVVVLAALVPEEGAVALSLRVALGLSVVRTARAVCVSSAPRAMVGLYSSRLFPVSREREAFSVLVTLTGSIRVLVLRCTISREGPEK